MSRREEQRAPPRRSGGHSGVRALGWVLGLAVIAGVGALVYTAMTRPEAEIQAAVKPPRKCPPDVSIPARALGQPVDDVLGVRPGMNARDVNETVKCVSEDYVIEPIEYRGAVTGAVTGTGRKTRPALRVKRGQDMLTFALFGPQGQERVVGGWREASFDAGAGPTLGEVEGLFTTQYGAPHESRDTPNGERVLSWTYGPDGAPLRVKPRDGASDYIPAMVTYMAAGWTVAACIRNARTDPAMAPAWDGRCGLTIRAEIDPQLSDRAHVARWRLVAIDQATLARQAAPLRSVSSPAPK